MLCWDNVSLQTLNSGTYNFLVDTIYPNISYVSAPVDGSSQGTDWIFLNVSVNDSNNVSAFIDFDGSLVSWWRMDDLNSSGDVIDYTGRNNGSVEGDAVQTDAGKFGKGFAFDGDATEKIATNYGNGMNSTAVNKTYSTWVKWNSGAGSASPIFLTQSTSSGNARIYLGISSNNWGMGIGDSSYSVTSGVAANTNWHLITLTLNGTGAGLFLDGTRIHSKTLASFNFDKNLDIGYYDGNYPFAGILDDVLIFNRTLSAEEIKSLYANTTSKFVSNNFTSLSDGTHTFKGYVQDIAGNVNTTEQRSIMIGYSGPPNGNKFAITNSSGDTVASFDNKGDVYLKGTYSESQSSLSPPAYSFIIQNTSGDTISYINSSGYLFMLGTVSKFSDLSGRTSGNLEFRNASDDLIAFFDNQGNLKLKNGVAQNYANP